MTKTKSVNIASLMMLLWLAVFVFATFYAQRWADFLSIIGCTLPMVLFKRGHRGKTFGTRDSNTVKYKKKEYALLMLFGISGSAVISAVTYLVINAGYVETTTQRSDFLYLLVFGCLIPAFFEEWLVRGGVLGALKPIGAKGVWLSAIFFMLMHAEPTKYLYAFFAGFMIGSLVYLTECIYLGFLMHFLNNFASLLLSYVPKGNGEYVALGIIIAICVLSFNLLKKTNLFADTKKIVMLAKKDDTALYEEENIFTPLFYTFVALAIGVMILRVL